MSADNPWMHTEGVLSGYATSDSRLRVLRIKQSHDVAWLLRVLKYSDNQVAVIQAAERRLRVLMKKQYLT